jgi:hypothetical protein
MGEIGKAMNDTAMVLLDRLDRLLTKGEVL